MSESETKMISMLPSQPTPESQFMPRIYRLPDELLLSIFTHVDQAEPLARPPPICDLQLVSRRFNNIATTVLQDRFAELCVTATRRSVDRFKQLCACPTLVKGIKRINYIDNFLIDSRLDTVEDFAADLIFNRIIEERNLSTTQIAKAHQDHVQRHREQSDVLSTNEDIRAIIEHAKSLPNLERLAYQDVVQFSHYSSLNLPDTVPQIGTGGYSLCRTTGTFDTLNVDDEFLIEDLQVGTSQDGRKSCLRVLEALAEMPSEKRPRDLYLAFPFNEILRDGLQYAFIHKTLKDGFRRLTKLDIMFGPAMRRPSLEASRVAAGKYIQLLQAAPALKSLTIRFPPAEASTLLAQLCRECHWPSLRELHLEHTHIFTPCPTAPAALKDFLRRHEPTLTRLTLSQEVIMQPDTPALVCIATPEQIEPLRQFCARELLNVMECHLEVKLAMTEEEQKADIEDLLQGGTGIRTSPPEDLKRYQDREMGELPPGCSALEDLGVFGGMELGFRRDIGVAGRNLRA